MAASDPNSHLLDFIAGIKALRISEVPVPKVASKEERVTRQDVLNLAKALHKEITTFTLFLQEPMTRDEFLSFAKQMDAVIFTLLEYQQRMYNIPASRTLKHKIDLVVNNILTAIEQLTDALYKKQTTKKNSQDAAQLTGLVWKCSDDLKAIPIDNREAALQEISLWCATIKDAYSEVHSAEMNAKKKLSNKSEEADEEDFDDFEDEFSEEEYKVLSHCFLLIKSAFSLATLVQKLVGHYIVDDSSPEAMELLETLQGHIKNLSGEVDEVGSNVYPPQDLNEIRGAVESLNKLCKEIIDLILGEVGARVFSIQNNQSQKIIGMINTQIASALSGLNINDG